MLVLPWYIRFGIDCVIIATPFLYLHNHPTTHLFQYFQNKRRLGRRLSYEQMTDNINPNGQYSIEETKKIYKQLGVEL